MASTPYTRARADYARLVSMRMRTADDDKLTADQRKKEEAARERMQEEAVVAAVEKALAKAPKLSDELRERIVAMLS